MVDILRRLDVVIGKLENSPYDEAYVLRDLKQIKVLLSELVVQGSSGGDCVIPSWLESVEVRGVGDGG